MFFEQTSIVCGENCAQVTTNGKGFTHFFPIKSKSQAYEGLVNLINEYGVPDHIVTDGAQEEGNLEVWKTNWAKLVKRFHIKQSVTQPYCWWQNCAEREIGEIRRDICRYTARKQSPKRLWGYCGAYVTGKRNMTAQNTPASLGRTGYELVTGETPDISEYLEFGFYD